MKRIIVFSLFLLCAYRGFSQIILQESFDNSLFPPAGWKNQRTAPSASTTDNLWERVAVSNLPVTSTHSGAGMAFYNSYSFPIGTKTDLITSVLNLSSGSGFVVKFWMYRDGSSPTNPDQIDVYISTSQGGGTLLGTVSRSIQLPPAVLTTGWYQYSFAIPNNYSGTVNYIIFKASSSIGSNMLIDDVEVGTGSSLCAYPANLNCTKLSTTTASVQWAAPVIAPDNYEWEVRTSGIAGSGSTGLISNGNSQGTFADITGLVQNAAYTFYVRSSCGGAKSIWANPLDFKTACSINSIPFSENFDGVTAPALPNCFTVENRNSGNTWVNTSLGSSFSPYSSPNAIIYATQYSVGADDWIYTPAIAFNKGVYYRMQFWYKTLFSGFPNKIEIKYGKVPAASAMNSSVIYSNNGIDNANFQQASFVFTVPDTSVYYIGIHNITPAGAYNYQMMMDNMLIDIGPDPGCAAVNITTDSVGLTSAVFSWQNPASGTSTSYNWEVRTSGLPGSGYSGLFSSGNISATDSFTVPALSMGTAYKFYLKANCTTSSYGVWSGGVAFTTQTTSCGNPANLTSSAIKKDGFRVSWIKAGVTSPVTIFDWEVRTSGAAGSGNMGLVTSGATTNLYADVTGLVPLADYIFYVRAHCASGNNSNYVSVNVATGVINDICADAIELAVGKGFSTQPQIARLDKAFPTTGLSSSCALLSNGSGTSNSLNDVWYKITIPATGNAIVQTHIVTTGGGGVNINSANYNSMLIAYTGSCNNLIEIACDRDGAPDDYWGLSTFQSRIAFTGRTPGEIIYLRVLPDAQNSQYVYFQTQQTGISAWDTTANILPPVSPGGNCFVNPAITFNYSVNTDGYFRWNPIFDSAGKIVAEISPNNILGTVSTSSYINNGSIRRSSSGKYLLDRNLFITAQNKPSGFPAYVRIYYTKEELKKLINVAPAVDYDFTDVLKANTVCNSLFSGFEKKVSSIKWGRYGQDYYAEFETDSLGSFFISAGSSIITVCAGGNTTLVSDVVGVTYKWQIKTDTGFADISDGANYTGAANNSLQISNFFSGWYGNQYRCVATNGSYIKYSRIFKLQFTNTWTGATDNKWENAGNWSCGVIPDNKTDVIIKSGTVQIESKAVCKSLTISSAAQLNISDGNGLDILH